MFESLEALCEEFGLDKGLSKPKLRTEIKKRMSSIHADKTGGDFSNEVVKQLYLRMQEALRYLETPAKVLALQRQTSKSDGLELRMAALEARSESQGMLLVETAERESRASKKRYRAQLVASAIFAAICAAILPFSQDLAKNHMFSPFASAVWLRVILAAIFLASGAAFLVTRSKELILKRKISTMLSEDGIAWTVRSMGAGQE